MKFHKMYETSDLLDLVYASFVLSRNFLRWCDKQRTTVDTKAQAGTCPIAAIRTSEEAWPPRAACSAASQKKLKEKVEAFQVMLMREPCPDCNQKTCVKVLRRMAEMDRQLEIKGRREAVVWNRQVALSGKQVEMVGKQLGRARLSQSNSSAQAGTCGKCILGYDKWQDVDPTWAEPLFQALRDGVRTIRLSHSYQNKFGEEVRSWYIIDCQHTNYYVTQENEATGRRRWLRAIHLMALPAVTLRPPTEHLADPAGPADVPTDL